MSKWIYQYIRADRARIDMGLYETKKDAETARKEHASYGVLTFGPYEVSNDYNDYKRYEGSYKGSWKED